MYSEPVHDEFRPIIKDQVPINIPKAQIEEALSWYLGQRKQYHGYISSCLGVNIHVANAQHGGAKFSDTTAWGKYGLFETEGYSAAGGVMIGGGEFIPWIQNQKADYYQDYYMYIIGCDIGGSWHCDMAYEYYTAILNTDNKIAQNSRLIDFRNDCYNRGSYQVDYYRLMTTGGSSLVNISLSHNFLKSVLLNRELEPNEKID